MRKHRAPWIMLGVGLMATVVFAAVRIQPAEALTTGFQLYLPVPPGATVIAGGPHPWLGGSTGTQSSVDLGPASGEMAVVAAASGTAHVYSSGSWANCWVAIDHQGGWQTRYMHLKNVDTSINGRTVLAGQRLGDAGKPGAETCGSGTFRHVHFSLWRSGSAVAINGYTIGGYTVHGTGSSYCGWWTRDSDGAVVADARTRCLAVPQLINNRRQVPYWYNVVNRNSGKCVDVRWAATSDGAPIQQYSCNGTYAQQFHFRPLGGGAFQVQYRNSSSKGWDVKDRSTASGARIQLWSYVGGSNQKWRLVFINGDLQFKPLSNLAMCLDVPGASTADGRQLQQYSCNGTYAQAFRLVGK
jgi:hypothetical protein